MMIFLKVITIGLTLVLSSVLGHLIVINFLRITKLSPEGATNNNASRWIGYLERALIAFFVCLNLTTQTIFIFATKAAVMGYRIPKDVPSDKQKTEAEYMLIGTMVSYLVALMFGFMGNAIMNIWVNP